uniref:U-box domain-containing protein n=1 Tax=Amphiprion ocellaris TaxID=80972 RepID=A0AAQ5YXV4_AMPOC
MDRGQACKRLEISTSSDLLPSTDHRQVQQKEGIQVQVKDQSEQNREKHQKRDSKSQQSNGHQWSLQAQKWGEESPDGSAQRGHVFKCQSNTESSNPEPEFKLLRVTLPFGGAASSLGLKTLVVWGQPARCCPAEEVERIKRVHEASARRLPRPAFPLTSARQTTQPPQAPPSSSIPEEFLDPITQEVMMLPMLLPSGVSVDNTTLEEHQKREATWGRPPNDPFTGVPFTSTSQPLPNPQLKSRIDQFLLQKGMMSRDGMLGRQEQGENPQASRLIASKLHGQSWNSPHPSTCSKNSTAIQYNADSINTKAITQIEGAESGPSSDYRNHMSNTLSTDSKSELDRRKKRDLRETSRESTEVLTAEKQLLPQTKRPRNDSTPAPNSTSHEQRLSASLDEALFSALQGRPSFTSNLVQQRQLTPDPEPLKPTQQSQSSGFPGVASGEKTCSACFSSISAYSTTASSIYRLTCGHFLCRACLQRESKPPKSATKPTSSHISCPTCQSSTPRSHIIRVHH